MTTRTHIFDELPDYVGSTVTTTHDGFDLSLRMESDDYMPAPWDNEDGHGPVSDWRRPRYNGHAHKYPGELELCNDHGSARFYDFAEACRIARRDGWGVSPASLGQRQHDDGTWTVTAQWRDGRYDLQTFTSTADDINAAVRDVYAQHRATYPSDRAYAAAAARSDFERLQRWCNGDWYYASLIVTASRDGIELGSASVCGIESDSGDYMHDIADDLAAEAIDDAREAIKSLCDCEGED